MTVTEYDGGWTVKKKVDVDKLFDLINQLDEPTLSKKVQLSQKTADVLNLYKERGYSLKDLLDVAGSKQAQEKIARAWLDGYEVEEEPKYRARLKVITDEFIASYLRTQCSNVEDRLKALEIGSKYIHEDYRHLSEFTEDELKMLDIWDSDQWEIEELEE